MARAPAAVTMMTFELATALLLATATCDLLGHTTASFYLLLFGVPITAIAGLVSFAGVVDAVEGGGLGLLGRLGATASALLVASVVLGAAVRAPALASNVVPAAATVALAAGLVLLLVDAVLALGAVRR